MYRRYAIVAALLAFGSPGAQAAGLKISQLAYRSPDLLVFVDRGDSAPALKSLADSSVKAALGDRTLDVKSAAPWRRETGTAVLVALDISGSMKSVDFPNIVQALDAMLDGLPARSSAALLTIGADVKVPVGFGPVSEVKAALAGLTPDAPETALNEGVIQAQAVAGLNRANVPKPARDVPLRRFVILVTDGVDESKKAIGSREMLDAVEAGNVPVFMAAVTRTSGQRHRLSGLEPLATVARASGGGFVQTTSQNLASDLNALVDTAMRADLLTIDCKPCTRDGSVRTMQISMNSDNTIVSGVREVRLLAEESPPAPPPPPTPPPVPPPAQPVPAHHVELDWISKIKINVELVLPWRLFLALLALLLPATAAGGYVYRRQIKVYVLRIFRRGPDPKPTIILDPKSTTIGPKSVELTVDVAGAGRQQVKVGETDVVLGRSTKATVAAESDREASNKHAALYIQKGILMVRDLGSSNGTFLNGTRIVRPEPVHDHDVVRVGRTDVRIYFGRL